MVTNIGTSKPTLDVQQKKKLKKYVNNIRQALKIAQYSK